LIINNDLIVVDEVGPFELDGKVWADSLTHLLGGQKYSLLLVVREQLVSRVIQQWSLKNAMIFEIGQVKPTQVSAAILSQKSRT
jgi:nucleoside-triphosphatase THEP1